MKKMNEKDELDERYNYVVSKNIKDYNIKLLNKIIEEIEEYEKSYSLTF